MSKKPRGINKTIYIEFDDIDIWRKAQMLVRRKTDISLAKALTSILETKLIPQLESKE